VQCTADFFRVLGVEPALGRTFLQKRSGWERSCGGTGNNVWHQRFGADPTLWDRLFISIQTIYSSWRPSRSFSFPFPTIIGHGICGFRWYCSQREPESNNYLNVIARLKLRTALRSAQADVDTIAPSRCRVSKVIPGFGMKLAPCMSKSL